MPVQKSRVQQPEKPRERKFTEIKVVLHSLAGNNPITESDMKGILGWEVVEAKDGSTLGRRDDYLFAFEGKYIKCHNNAKNRPFSEEWGHTLSQVFLKKQFKLNGETMIIGETGLVLSAQHRGFGFMIACSRWRQAKAKRDSKKELHPDELLILKNWPDGPPIFEGIIVYGVKEDQETISTLDYNRPRTFGDVLYTSGVFAGKKFGNMERERMTKMLANAIKVVWERTGMRRNREELTEYLTNPEITQYVQNHQRLAEAVKHIHAENLAKKEGEKVGPIANLIGPGTAAGLLYLMGYSNADPTKYQKSHPREEKALTYDKKTWEKAEQFWTCLVLAQSQRCPEVEALIEGFKKERDPETGKEASIRVKIGLLVNAWNVYKQGDIHPQTGKWTGEIFPYYDDDQEKVGLPGNIALEKKKDQFEVLRVACNPCLGGIDVLPEEEAEDIEETREEIEARIKAEREKKQEEMLEQHKAEEKAAWNKIESKEKELLDKKKAAASAEAKAEIITQPANNNPKKKPGLKGGL